jgi:hypothetical protein
MVILSLGCRASFSAGRIGCPPALLPQLEFDISQICKLYNIDEFHRKQEDQKKKFAIKSFGNE